MSSIAVVTSCSAKGWEEYGERFVETFLKYWPVDVGLHLVSEDLVASVRAWRRPFKIHDLWHSDAALMFHLRHLRNPGAHGFATTGNIHANKIKKNGYDFRQDAYKFAKKVFAIDLVGRTVGSGRLIWVDADVVTFGDVSRDLLEQMLPLDRALSCLDRGSYHSECGFVGYNLGHTATLPFIREFAALYATDQVFELGEWHDSWVFDWLRKKLNVPTFAIPHNSRHHPLPNSDLGSFMDHLKGARKNKGRTPPKEILSSKKRALPYWSDTAS